VVSCCRKSAPHCWRTSRSCRRWQSRDIPMRAAGKSVPKRGPKTIIRQPTPTKRPIKNGPEIDDFRPVLESRATLANRRLRPLGHLTARLQVYETQPLTRPNPFRHISPSLPLAARRDVRHLFGPFRRA
jgi:hypothetical protein